MARDDYALWRLWWTAALYGASPAVRMRVTDGHRARKALP